MKKIYFSGLRPEVMGKVVNIGAEPHPYILNQTRMTEDIAPKSRHMTTEGQQSKVIGRMGKGRADANSLPGGQCCSFLWLGRKVGSL